MEWVMLMTLIEGVDVLEMRLIVECSLDNNIFLEE